MDDPTLTEAPTTRAARWFQPSPPELLGLAVLVLGAVVASALLWFQAAQRPVPPARDGSHTAIGPAASAGAPAIEPGSEAPQAPEAAPDTAADLTIHVTGGVLTPGVVVVPAGGRVADAVAAAGGLSSDAEVEHVNLARVLGDGEHVHLPRLGEDLGAGDAASGGSPAPGGSGGVTADGRVDINRAEPEQLESLPGVGPARASAIVAYRDEHGPFAVPGDLRGVPGIGEATFQQLAELVVVG